ncbi:MAG: phosphonate ABC transporter, permease protein PhnE [Bdellovibrionia bacterium]
MKAKFWLSLTFVIALGIFSLPALEGSPREISWWDQLVRLAHDFFPPDFSIWQDITEGLKETFQIAYWATGLALIFSLPVSVLAAKKTSRPWLSQITLLVISAIRTIPSLIWAIIAVSLIGPYPLAGVLALTLYSVSYLAKFFTDAIDSMDFHSYQWLRLHGHSQVLSFYYGVWPEIKGLLLSQTLWMFEYNIRSAAIIGYVGAGGLGLKLHTYQEFGQWDRFSAVLIIIFVIVVIMEQISRRLKK